jgi:hypothetical protein
LRNSRVIAVCLAGITYASLLLARGWRGLDQIASDPGYNWIDERVSGGWSILKLRPYLHLDSPLIASVVSSLPREWHGVALTLITHTTWLVCALTIFTVLQSRAFGTVMSFIGGLLLVTTPWAAQSAIGNFGNIRWPILVAAAVVLSAEVAHGRPRTAPMVIASAVATLSNPLHPLLLAPLVLGWKILPSKHRVPLAVAAAPLSVGLLMNLVNANTGGHSAKILNFWEGAGLFWVSGQVLPVAVALTGLALSARSFRSWSERQVFAVSLLLMVVLSAAASYRLGGIADRYYVAPACLAAIGTMVALVEFRSRSANIAKVLAVVLSVMLLVPTVRWFFIFPYLRTAPSWSAQVENAREQCATGEIRYVELVASSGDSRTDPIPCDDL